LKFPDIQTNRLAIKLKPAAERMVKRGHPWIFDEGIVKQSAEGKAGDLAIIFDQRRNKFLACGLYDPDSPIRIKIIHHTTSVSINSDFFREKITTAYDIRKPLFETKTNSYRFIYGENDGFPGLIVDVYADVLVLKLYSWIWLPYLNDILEHLVQVSGCKTVVLRLSRKLESNKLGLSDGQVIFGTLADEVVIFEEHGLRFAANVVRGHKTGYFLDHRHNRKRIGELAKGKTVLDVFAYAGGFSVHALAGGASAVTSLDISKQALEMAKQNAELNPHTGTHKTLAADAFVALDELISERKSYDIVVIDPPSFAKRAKEIDKAKHSYKRLARLGAQLVKNGGILVLASCSSRIDSDVFFEICETSMELTRHSHELLEKTYHDIDHPISFPEGAYLKCGYWRI